MKSAYVRQIVADLAAQGWPKGYISFMTGLSVATVEKIVSIRRTSSTIQTKQAA